MTLILEDSPHRFLISSVTFIMALLVAQTRVESGVHSSSRSPAARVLGALVTLVLFQVLRMTDAVTDCELLAAADAAAARAYAPYSNFHVGVRGARARRPGVRGRERRERGVPARRLRRADGVLAGGRRGVPAGRLRGRRDHRVAVRRLPAVAARVGRRPRRLPQRRACRDA